MPTPLACLLARSLRPLPLAEGTKDDSSAGRAAEGRGGPIQANKLIQLIVHPAPPLHMGHAPETWNKTRPEQNTRARACCPSVKMRRANWPCPGCYHLGAICLLTQIWPRKPYNRICGASSGGWVSELGSSSRLLGANLRASNTCTRPYERLEKPLD